MNIEEIVEYFKDDIDYLEEELKYPNFKGRYITIRDKECEYLKKLLDYITNLQEENDKFYDETMKDIKEHLIDRIKRQEQEIERLNKENEELKKIQCTFLGTGCKVEMERLTKLCNKYEEEHKTTFETWQKDIKGNEQLHSIIKEVREYIERCQLGVDGRDRPVMLKDQKEGKELLEILDKGE